jgi:hypothetical protein
MNKNKQTERCFIRLLYIRTNEVRKLKPKLNERSVNSLSLMIRWFYVHAIQLNYFTSYGISKRGGIFKDLLKVSATFFRQLFFVEPCRSFYGHHGTKTAKNGRELIELSLSFGFNLLPSLFRKWLICKVAFRFFGPPCIFPNIAISRIVHMWKILVPSVFLRLFSSLILVINARLRSM